MKQQALENLVKLMINELSNDDPNIFSLRNLAMKGAILLTEHNHECVLKELVNQEVK